MANFNAVLDIQFDEGTITEPVTLQEVKDWLKIDVTDEDILLEELITSGRQLCESYTGLGFITRDIVAVLNNSCGNIYLPYSPITSDIVLKDVDDNVITSPSIRGVLSKWINQPIIDYIKAEYTAGYAVLPVHFKNALLTTIAYLYEHRGDEEAGKLSPMALELLTPYKVV
jgi:hypothetical protein